MNLNSNNQKSRTTIIMLIAALLLVACCCMASAWGIWKQDIFSLKLSPATEVEPTVEGTWGVSGDPTEEPALVLSGNEKLYPALIFNDTAVNLCQILFSPADSSFWGNSVGSISPGNSLNIDLPAGEYDVRALDCVQATHHAVRIRISSADYPTIVVGGTSKIALHVLNTSAFEVCYIQASPTLDDAWGEDLLSMVESLHPGAERYFYLYPGIYDLRALDCHEKTLFMQGNVSLEQDATWTLEGQD